MSDERLERHEADLQRWIDGLLRAGVGKTVAPLALRSGVDRSRRRKRIITSAACGLAAAATLAFALLKLPANNAPQIVSAPPPTNQIPATPVATFIATGDLITIPLESGDPSVTIVQIYPSTLTHQLRRRKAAFAPILSRTETKPGHSIRGG